MGECVIQFKRYPVSKQTGYSGCGCTGIDSYVIPALDCSSNNYMKLPYSAMGEVRNQAYEDISGLYNNINTNGTRLNNIKDICNVNYDPFLGVFVDMYTGFGESGLSAFISDSCYGKRDKMLPGFLPANIKQTLFPDDCECD